MKTKIDTNISIEHVVDFKIILDLAIDKLGPKKVLDIIFAQCFYNTLEKCSFPSSLLATNRDEEKADVTAALYYLRKNWKSASEKGLKLMSEKIKNHTLNDVKEKPCLKK